MRKIAVIDNRRNFINDISTRILLNEGRYSFDVVELVSNPAEIDRIIEQNKVDEICISEDVAYTRSDWDIIGPKITVYASSMTGVSEILKKKLCCYGVAKTAGVLLELIEKGKTTGNNQSDPSPQVGDKYNAGNDVSTVVDSSVNGHECGLDGSDSSTNKYVKNESDNGQNTSVSKELDDVDDFIFGTSSGTYKSTVSNLDTKPYADDNRKNNKRSYTNTTDSDCQKKKNEYDDKDKAHESVNTNTEQIHRSVDKELFGDDYRELVDIRQIQNDRDKEDEIYDSSFTASDAIQRKKKKKASIITTYSAKGGVGKTTIACNLATYIAMTSNGRRHNRVCIIDYNFDFGDVLNTLSFDSSDVTMIDWAVDIRRRMESGEKPEGIAYNKADIEKYLQVNATSGLYALLAPTSHIDALSIHGKELSVMINNIFKYGDFDYIICDTGNNTRNSSMMSLERADYIIMIATQDVTTVHDNRSFLDAVRKMNNVDENNVLLVINKAKSKKETLISCKEVEDSLDVPCVAHLKETVDVIKANNTGRPIVFNKNHEYTKGIGNIAARITGIGTYEPANSNAITKVIDKVKYFFGF